MINSLKKYAWHELVLGVLASIAGLVTVILSIIKLCNEDADPTAALRIILGVMLILFGVCAIVVAFVASEKEGQASGLVGGSLLVGFGAFLFTDWAAGFLSVIVCYIYPILIASVGGIFIVKGIVDLCQKKDTVSCVVLMVVGAVMVTLGVVFAVFATDWAGKVSWLIVGLSILTVGVFEIIRWVKFLKKVK